MLQKKPPSTSCATHHASAATACFRVGPLVSLPAVLRSLGCDATPVLERAGFNLEQFADPDYRIPFIAGSKLLASCVSATGCDHLGLLLGERADPSHLGLAGFLLQSAPDVGAALRGLLDYLHLHDEGGDPTLVTSGETTFLGFAIHLSGVEARDQIYDLSVAMAYKIMRGLCGDGWAPREVLFMRRPPPDLARYKKFFQAPLRFDSDQSAVAFPTHWLGHPLPSRDPLLHDHLVKEAEGLCSTRKEDFAHELRRLLRQCLTSGQCSVPEIAKQLGMHERTFNRRLAAEGTSFRHELEQVRHTLADQLLSATNANMTEIAISLGYADASAFIHAYKRWSGFTPAQWRTNHPHSDDPEAHG